MNRNLNRRAFANTVAILVLTSAPAFAAATAPSGITCKHIEMATVSQVDYVTEYVLQNNGNGGFEAHYVKHDANGNLEQEINIDATEYALKCNFGSKNPLVFSCRGGSRMGPFYSSSEKLTTENIGWRGDSEEQSHYKMSIYKAISAFPPKPDPGPTAMIFKVSECTAK